MHCMSVGLEDLLVYGFYYIWKKISLYYNFFSAFTLSLLLVLQLHNCLTTLYYSTMAQMLR